MPDIFWNIVEVKWWDCQREWAVALVFRLVFKFKKQSQTKLINSCSNLGNPRTCVSASCMFIQENKNTFQKWFKNTVSIWLYFGEKKIYIRRISKSRILIWFMRVHTCKFIHVYMCVFLSYWPYMLSIICQDVAIRYIVLHSCVRTVVFCLYFHAYNSLQKGFPLHTLEGDCYCDVLLTAI